MRRAAVLGLALSLVACGGHAVRPAPSASSPAMAAAPDYAQQYLQIVTPANAALAVAKPKLNTLPASATGADVARILAPYLAASQAMDEALLRAPWPANVLPDVRALVTADKVLEAQLETAGAQTALSLAGWENTLAQDMGALNAAVAVVRADLGLPPSGP